MRSPERGMQTPEEESGRKFFRITPEQFDSLPDGTELRQWDLTDQTDEIVVKGVDEISKDIRGGFMAYGFFEKDLPEGLEVDENGMVTQEKIAKE